MNNNSHKIRKSYNFKCPDCYEDIPSDVVDGASCNNCGHVFYKPESNPESNYDLDQNNPVDVSRKTWQNIYSKNPDLLDYSQDYQGFYMELTIYRDSVQFGMEVWNTEFQQFEVCHDELWENSNYSLSFDDIPF